MNVILEEPINMTVRKLDKRHIILEDKSIDNLKERMKQLIKEGKYRLNFKHGYSINENVTHYVNIKEGERWQGILEHV